MTYRFHGLLIFFLVNQLACGRLTNAYDETILKCGALPDANGHYVQLLNPDGEPLPGSQLTGKVLESGAIIQTLDFTPKGCFRAPDQGFVIIRSQDLKLSRSLNATELHTTPKLILKEDKAFKLLPSEPLKDRRAYFGQTFYFVDPGYVLNFYSEDNLKNIEIEYCIDEIKDLEDYDFGPLECLQPKYYFIDNLPRLEQGFWSVRYRKQTELGDAPWSRYLLAVRVKCEGVLRDLDVLAATRCTDIDNLEIKGSSSLERLKYVSKVSGNLRLEANNSISLRGIHNISSVGQLWIIGMTALKSLDFSPHRVKGEILIAGNPVLEDIDGLVHLENIERDLVFSENFALKSLYGLRNVKFIEGSLLLYANANLENLDGLSQLKRIGGGLHITFMDKLQSLKGLSRLEEIGDTLSIAESDKLTNLDGLSQLRSVTNLSIAGNNVLLNLDPILNLELVKGEIGIEPFALCQASNLASHPEKPVAVYCRQPPPTPEPTE